MSVEGASPVPPDGHNGDKHLKKLIDIFACVTACVLLLTFFAAVTKFRLWHTNRWLQKLLEVAENPITYLMSYLTGYIAVAQYRNDLYVTWLVVLTIAYDNVITISTGSDPKSSWLLLQWIHLFQGIYIAYLTIRRNGDDDKFFVPLLILWAFLLLKFSFQLVYYKHLERVYGYSNSRLICDYMKVEHELTKPNESLDPTDMKGYKYLVIGETMIAAKTKEPEYMATIKLPADVITVERVWSCNERILHPSIDKDKRFRDVCLSFSFFKLLKRSFFEFPAAETQHAKTRKLVFDGLLKRDNDSVFSIIEMEIGLLRDLFYTWYPAVFVSGFPVFQIVVLIGMLGVSLWISYNPFDKKKTK